MAKRKAGKPFPADWNVRDHDGNLTPVMRARFARDARGGYVFTDADGPVADFPPGTVTGVFRIGPERAARDDDPGPTGTGKPDLAPGAAAMAGLADAVTKSETRKARRDPGATR